MTETRHEDGAWSETTPQQEPKAECGPLIEATDLRLGYGRGVVLDHVRLAVQPGQFWFFVGPNATGKTTLFRAILGTLTPLAGAIRTHIGRHSIGYVPQRCDFNPALPTTLGEFVLLGLVGVSAKRSEQRSRLAWALEKVGLTGLERHDYWSLSGGQRQRALVARALVRRPQLLLADEPTDGLDLTTQNALLAYLADLHQTEGLTVVLITHDLALAARHSTHVAFFHGGRVLCGRTAAVLTPANLQAAYQLPSELCAEILAVSPCRTTTKDSA